MGTRGFSGPGPFEFPLAQSARADCGDDCVVLSFRVLVDGGRTEVVRIPISSEHALGLAAQIARSSAANVDA